MVLNEYNNLVAKCYAGDLLDARVDMIFHVTNCMGVMGGGIAKSIKNKWPKVFTECELPPPKVGGFLLQ